MIRVPCHSIVFQGCLNSDVPRRSYLLLDIWISSAGPGPGSSKLGLRTTAAIVFGRLVLVPPTGLGIVMLADKLGFLPAGDKMFRFVLLLQHTMPTSVLSGKIHSFYSSSETCYMHARWSLTPVYLCLINFYSVQVLLPTWEDVGRRQRRYYFGFIFLLFSLWLDGSSSTSTYSFKLGSNSVATKSKKKRSWDGKFLFLLPGSRQPFVKLLFLAHSIASLPFETKREMY